MYELAIQRSGKDDAQRPTLYVVKKKKYKKHDNVPPRFFRFAADVAQIDDPLPPSLYLIERSKNKNRKVTG